MKAKKCQYICFSLNSGTAQEKFEWGVGGLKSNAEALANEGEGGHAPPGKFEFQLLLDTRKCI